MDMFIGDVEPGDIFAAIHDVLRAKTAEACTAIFRAVLDRCDIDTFATGEVDLRSRSRSVFHVIDWPDDWRHYYFSSGLVHRDPLVTALEHRVSPFTWAELRADRTLPQAGTEALERTAEAGWVDGLVVPLPRGGGKRVGIVSIVARRTLISDAQKHLLPALCICYHERLRGLVSAQRLPVPPAGLTSREFDCLALIARGMSDRQIATELGMAVSTAHEHVENARKRFEAATRAELAAAAVSLGVIHF
ncbi:autoinducer binding domain-containing protein [Pararhizobium sp. O133]|uniref:helix-turn-helix transcriptional regulator n=1 Tax=Pararhizobium sp. O133 TaxID=3449278 RepID=UPI003F6837C2